MLAERKESKNDVWGEDKGNNLWFVTGEEDVWVGDMGNNLWFVTGEEEKTMFGERTRGQEKKKGKSDVWGEDKGNNLWFVTGEGGRQKRCLGRGQG